MTKLGLAALVFVVLLPIAEAVGPPSHPPFPHPPLPPGCLGEMDENNLLDEHTMSGPELVGLLRSSLSLGPADKRITFLVDLPKQKGAEIGWTKRIHLAHEWAKKLQAELPDRTVQLALYEDVGSNNADLPFKAWVYPLNGPVPTVATELRDEQMVSIVRVLRESDIVIGMNQNSTTAPLKLLAAQFGFRGASMPQFNSLMIPALRLDYGAVNRRCLEVKHWLDQADTIEMTFHVHLASLPPLSYHMTFDLRYRTVHASGGLIPERGMVANLPSGETYVVPYEGDREGIPSRTEGMLPVQMGEEVVLYQIQNNRAVRVHGSSPNALREGERIFMEPAYANIAEVGFGVLSEMGVAALPDTMANLLLNEKLGLHIAFGRSDHLGGTVGSAAFAPRPALHIDRLFVSNTGKVRVKEVLLRLKDGGRLVYLMRDGRYDMGTPYVFPR